MVGNVGDEPVTSQDLKGEFSVAKARIRRGPRAQQADLARSVALGGAVSGVWSEHVGELVQHHVAGLSRGESTVLLDWPASNKGY